MTGGVMTVAPEHHQAWTDQVAAQREKLLDDRSRAGAGSFLDALLVVLDGRSVDLPVWNPYRAFLLLIQRQIRAMKR
jgi:hypothetical protein